MKAEAGTGKRILHRKKFPLPDEKRGNAMPGESSALGGDSGETYSRRGDPTITTDSDEGFELD